MADLRIFDYYDISVIMPFYKKAAIFSKTIATNANYLMKNGLEVIIVMDECSEKRKVLGIINTYPFINWKIICNETTHEWRNPAKAINVGIRHAKYSNIFIFGPDSELAVDALNILKHYSLYYKDCYFVGKVTFQNTDFDINDVKDLKHAYFLTYGSLFVEKKYLEQIGGYNENLTSWGGDDDEIRARLELISLRKMIVPEIRLLHRDEQAGHNSRTSKSHSHSNAKRLSIFYPQNIFVNTSHWGGDFSNILFDYKDNSMQYQQLLSFLDQFEDFEIKDENIFLDPKKIVALIPVFNEESNIVELLEHLAPLCDGIIILDDGSTDRTYEIAQNEKLLLKLRRNRGSKIEELKIRNILLRIAGFTRSEWFFFMDADERFHSNYNNLYKVIQNSLADSACFYLVHIWNHNDRYRIDLVEKSPINEPGLLFRWRMFKNHGHSQIYFHRNVHVPSVPFRGNIYIPPILILHYGMRDGDIRAKKKIKYDAEEEQNEVDKFNYFLDVNPQLKNIKEIPNLKPVIVYKNNYG